MSGPVDTVPRIVADAVIAWSELWEPLQRCGGSPEELNVCNAAFAAIGDAVRTYASQVVASIPTVPQAAAPSTVGASEPTHNAHGYAMAYGLAKVHLDAYAALNNAECKIEEALYHCPLLAGTMWNIDRVDPYDDSLELRVGTEEKADEIGAFVLSLGFARTWIHLHRADGDACERSDGEEMCSQSAHWSERYYHRDAPIAPSAPGDAR